jgi:drug/metabolite transporter (DMT)-like permease
MPVPSLDRASWIMLACLSLLWGASFLFMKVAGAELPLLHLVLIRVGVAAAVLQAAVAILRRPRPRGIRLHGLYLAMGLFNNVVPTALIVFATLRIGAGAASILNATTPIFTLLIAHAVTADEKITPAKALGIALGFLGVVAMAGPDALIDMGGEGAAILAMLGATFSYGISAMVGRSFRAVPAIVSAAYQLTASTLIVVPLVIVFQPPWGMQAPSGEALAAALALALVSTALAYILFFAIIARAGGTNVMLVTLMIPASGVFLAWLFLGEAFAISEAAGMALIGLGLVVIDGRVFSRKTRAPLV